jgi:hypothetical protein
MILWVGLDHVRYDLRLGYLCSPAVLSHLGRRLDAVIVRTIPAACHCVLSLPVRTYEAARSTRYSGLPEMQLRRTHNTRFVRHMRGQGG